MDKNLLLQAVLDHLSKDLEQANLAALSAHETATHEENVAENKYDTLGLEAAYLASGQARRVEELRQTLITWRQLRPRPFDEEKGIELGASIQLLDEQGQRRQLFLGPPGASMKLLYAGEPVQILGSTTPLGHALLGKAVGDDVQLPGSGKTQHFEVLRVE